MNIIRKLSIFTMIVACVVSANSLEAQTRQRKRPQTVINTLSYMGPYVGGGYSLLIHTIPDTRLYGGGTGIVGLQYYLRTPKKRFTFSTSVEAMYLTSVSGMEDFSLMGKYYYTDPLHQNLPMDYQVAFSKYREMHRQLSVNVPILFGKEFKNSYFGVGANVRYTLLGNYRTSTLLTTTATDPELVDGLSHMPTHNLSSLPNVSKGNLTYGLDVMLMGEVGLVLDKWMPQASLEYEMHKSVSYRLGFFASCGVLSLNNNIHDQSLVHFNMVQNKDGEDIVVAVKDIANVTNNSILKTTSSLDKALHSFVVGAKFSVLFQLNQSKYRTRKPPKKKTPTQTSKKAPSQKQKAVNEEEFKTYQFVVYDAETENAIPTSIVLTNLKDLKQVTYTTDEQGTIDVSVKKDDSYLVQIGMSGYMSYHDTLHSELPQVYNIALQPVKKNSVIVLDNIFFDTDKVIIKNTSTAALEELYDFMKNNPEVEILIIGHTDNVGEAEYNQRLSEGRAKAVKNEMVRRGVESNRMGCKGMGESQPITTNRTEEGRAINRRVEIKIL